MVTLAGHANRARDPQGANVLTFFVSLAPNYYFFYVFCWKRSFSAGRTMLYGQPSPLSIHRRSPEV